MKQNISDHGFQFSTGLLNSGTAPTSAAAPQDEPRQEPRLEALEHLICELKSAIATERSLEGSPDYKAAMEKANSLEKQLEEAGVAIFAQEPRTMSDLALRARIFEYWNEQPSDFADNRKRASYELVRAVLSLARACSTVLEPSTDHVSPSCGK